jgi:hypothetical protein
VRAVIMYARPPRGRKRGSLLIRPTKWLDVRWIRARFPQHWIYLRNITTLIMSYNVVTNFPALWNLIFISATQKHLIRPHSKQLITAGMIMNYFVSMHWKKGDIILLKSVFSKNIVYFKRQKAVGNWKNGVVKTLKLLTCTRYIVEPSYNDIGLYDTSSIASDILWYQLIPHF